jgi:predicted homoserine dehydrogenase-like protein
MSKGPPINVGIIGTGFVARHFALELERRQHYRLAKVLTRRPLERVSGFVEGALSRSLDELIEASDVVFECSGDVFHAATTVGKVLDAARPVVTLNAEFHATIGSHFVARGLLSEAEGDQPGSLAALREDALAMGFTPLVYANMKAFLNRNPTPEEMRYWAARQRFSVAMVTAFTDGTKVQIEQCLVANGLGAGIAKEELIGLETKELDHAARELGAVADQLGHPISDYVLDISLPNGVFVVARHDEGQSVALRNFKLGGGPYYLLVKDYCLAHLEAFKTIERLVRERRPLIDNGAKPRVSVASVAKRRLRTGERIERGYGSFDLRGICVNIADRAGHLPVCLARDCRIRRSIEPGQIIMLDDVELPETQALAAWRAIEEGALGAASAGQAQPS